MGSPDLHFSADLSTPDRVEEGDLLRFDSLEAMCCNVYASIPETAADMMRAGIDPMRCAYLVRDEQGTLLLKIEFAELLRNQGAAPPMTARSDDDWVTALADLQRRCDAAVSRLTRATAWLTRLSDRARHATR